MFMRALIVLLLVLNVGVAIWWTTREPLPPAVLVQPQGVARLKLLATAPSPAPRQSSPAAPATPVASVPASAIATQCFSFGPFATAAAVAAARAQLQPLVMRLAAREQFAIPPRGWRVYLPPLASPEAAQAEAQRLAAAGISDFLVLHDGAEANAIALGRYRGEDIARRRAAALVVAGFAAKAEPLGDPRTTTWLDVAAATGFDAAKTQAAVAAPQRRALDCAQVK